MDISTCQVEGDFYRGWFIVQDGEPDNEIEERAGMYAAMALYSHRGKHVNLDNLRGLECKIFREHTADPLTPFSFAAWKMCFKQR